MHTLDGGLDAASWYMRRPIATILNREPLQDVLVRFDPSSHVVSDNPALHEVWLRYSDLVVATITNGSPILGRVGAVNVWKRFAASLAVGILDVEPGDGPWTVPRLPDGMLSVNGVGLRGADEWRPPGLVTRLVIPPENLMRYADCVVVAVTGLRDAVDGAHVGLVAPDSTLTSRVMTGTYPRFAPAAVSA